ncbi:MAG: aldo/keto reductase [Synergistaceae bacterium]|nr:aldo/keto reductase [Synergistaceae bacterium]
MKKFILNNGLELPVMGFGTYKAESSNIILDAIKAGYTYFDTAEFYGTEKFIGQALTQGNISRGKIIIASKVWKTSMGYDETLAAFDKTLENLQTDYLDIYMIHWPRPDLESQDWKNLDLQTWRAMEDLYNQGRIKALGLSNFLPIHAENIINNCRIRPSVAQLEFHPGHTQAFALNYYRERNILVQAWSPTGRGRVLNDELIISLAKKYNVSTVQICLSFILSENVMSIPKSSSPERMRENLDSQNIILDNDDILQLENMPPVGWGGEHPDRVRIML